MLKSYLKAAVRHLKKQPVYSALNILGLALGMSICLLLILLVRDQRSYDQFHDTADRTYRLIAEADGSNRRVGYAATPAFLRESVQDNVVGVEHVTTIARLGAAVTYDGRSLTLDGYYADPSFFDVFDFEVTDGDGAAALSDPNRILLTEEAAFRLFGTADPMGAIVSLDGVGNMVVAGIVRTPERKTHLTFDVLAPLAALASTGSGRERLADAGNFHGFANYVVMREDASTESLEAYLEEASRRYVDTPQQYDLRIQPMTGITMGPMLNNEVADFTLPLVFVLVLAGLAAVILVASGMNYVSLTIARSIARQKEIGIRKVVGATRGQVVAQLLAESVVTGLCALLLSYVFLLGLLPAFDGLAFVRQFDVTLRSEMLFDARLAIVFLLFSVLVGLAAGLYPAFHLSRARAAAVLTRDGLGRGTSRMRLRKSLTLIQLVFSLLFITTTVLIYRQFAYMVDFDLGFRTADVVTIDLQGVSYTTLKAELLQLAGVSSVGAADVLPATNTNNGAYVSARPGDTLRVNRFDVDDGFLEALDLQLVAGRGFSTDGARPAPGVLVSETAARRLGFETMPDAVGATVFTTTHDDPVEILGVVKDYQLLGVARPIESVVFHSDPTAFEVAAVRLQPGTADAFVAHLESVWKSLDPVHPLEFSYYDRQVRGNGIFEIFSDLGRVVGLAALLAVVISCLGLMGIAAYNAQIRRKEIGIRKTVGAGTGSLVWLLSKEYVYLAAVAVAIAAPCAWLLNNLWLQRLANRVSFGAESLGVSAIVLLALALTAVVSQTLRAAHSDPVENLRAE